MTLPTFRQSLPGHLLRPRLRGTFFLSTIRLWLLTLSPSHGWCCRCFRALPLLEMHKDSAWGYKTCSGCYERELAGINFKLCEKRRNRVVEKHLREGKCLLCRDRLPDIRLQDWLIRSHLGVLVTFLVCPKCETQIRVEVMKQAGMAVVPKEQVNRS